jgi:DNA/RNA-binding domain of Phe-tRNA-synthetase-like protein
MSQPSVSVESHPKLDLAVFALKHANEVNRSESTTRLLSLDEEALALSPFDLHADAERYAAVKSAVRDLLRHGGYKPTGRGKPASEYLVKAVANQKLGSINPIVDTLNAVSLHSGLPISVVDLEKCNVDDSLRVAIAPEDSEYVFNASGQTIKLDGLLCLFDDEGPCANAVKDSQRTKTSDATQTSLVVIWGTNELPGHSAKTESWFRDLIKQQELGDVTDCKLQPSQPDAEE